EENYAFLCLCSRPATPSMIIATLYPDITNQAQGPRLAKASASRAVTSASEAPFKALLSEVDVLEYVDADVGEATGVLLPGPGVVVEPGVTLAVGVVAGVGVAGAFVGVGVTGVEVG